jgi:hypothetical protein
MEKLTKTAEHRRSSALVLTFYPSLHFVVFPVVDRKQERGAHGSQLPPKLTHANRRESRELTAHPTLRSAVQRAENESRTLDSHYLQRRVHTDQP